MKRRPIRRPFIGTPTRVLMVRWTNLVHHPDKPKHVITEGESRLALLYQAELNKRGVNVI